MNNSTIAWKTRMQLDENQLSRNLQTEGKDGTDYSYKSLWQVVEGYLTRWRIEETIRFVKQCYGFEHMHQRFNEVPEFFLYALAAGIKQAFVRYGNWETKAAVKKKDDSRIPRRRRPEGIVYKGCQRCRDGTSCRTSASDSLGSSEEAGSPASEEARGCKRGSDLRTQPAVLSRQGRLNEVRCLE